MLELNTNLLIDLGGWPAMKEARALLQRGAVREVQQEGALIRGNVQGAEKMYEPQITLAQRVANVEVRCTCVESRRSGRVCAHAIAAGLALLEGSRRRDMSVPGEGLGDARVEKVAGAGPRPGLGDVRPIANDEPNEPATPEIEVRLDGAFSGLTLELIARYGNQPFPVVRLADLPAGRNAATEHAARAEVEAAGFARVRSGAATLSLVGENKVARFLANVFPRWKRQWQVTVGPRLEATLKQIDFAEAEFALKENISHGEPQGAGMQGSSQDWLGLDLKLSVGGKPVAIEAAEVQRWLQTGQSHTRTANQRVLLVPTEAWLEMQEVLADCAVEQEPGRMRVARKFAPYLSGALAAQGFADRSGESGHRLTTAATIDVRSTLDENLWKILRPYQAQGVEWLAGVTARDGNALLADDMGLGKTVQALAFAAWLQKLSGSRRRDMSVPGDGRGDIRANAVAVAGPRDGRGNFRAAGKDRDQDSFSSASSESAPLSRDRESPSPSHGVRRLPILVVCPTSLVTNWIREAARFVPEWRALDLTGTDRAEKWARRGKFDLLVTSYAILRRDLELYREAEFSLVILDEAQHIKNRASQNAVAAKALRARHRLVLTGTPLENSILDLWSLFDFLVPGYLGTAAEFRERYETPLTKELQPKLLARLRHRVRPFFLRRKKEEVLTELPEKLEFPTLVELSDEQRAVYREVLAQGRREVFEHSDKAGRKSGRDRLAVLTTLLRLRQVCCHLDLLPRNGPAVAVAGPRAGRGDFRAEHGVRAKDDVSTSSPESEPSALDRPSTSPAPGGRGLPAEPAAATTDRWHEPSAKMERTFELIDEAIDGGHRVLLFSQFVQVLHLLRDEAQRRELRFCYLDGQTVERQAEVDRFQADAGIPIFFISLKAGGTGLNLTGADTVIHFDPWWNPAVEEQATARAHRMGQARQVQAYKLIAAGTVEEKIQALQARKRELFEASLGGDEAFLEKLSGADLEELLAE